MKSTICCRMEGSGQEVYRLMLRWDKALPAPEDISITGFYKEEQGKFVKRTKGVGYGEVTSAELKDGFLILGTTCFSNKTGFTLKIGNDIFTRKDFGEVLTDGLELFEPFSEGDVVYRLAAPRNASEKRPLILFLHGGGMGGTRNGRDNVKQLVSDYGPLNLALRYRDLYVMAPQCIEEGAPSPEMKKQSFFNIKDMRLGWTREYLGEVCDIIRRMIREGKVDERRVYVTGFSMGGAGTLTAMSVGSDLFAACVPICPSMSPETYNILRTIDAPVWAATSYVDHTIYRHKYITDAIMEQLRRGNTNAHLTIYSPEELAKYDVAVGDDLPYEKLFAENHLSWVPTYHDEHGILSWLLNQKKNS